jgi:hypothetical protein
VFAPLSRAETPKRAPPAASAAVAGLRELVAQAARAEAARRLERTPRRLERTRGRSPSTTRRPNDRYQEGERKLDSGLCDAGHAHRTRLQAVMCNHAARGVPAVIPLKLPPSPFSDVGWSEH